MMLTNETKIFLQEQFNLSVTAYKTDEEAENQLAEKINYLIQTNFESLVNLLYRIDVNEKKLRQLLIDHPNEDAGKTIARLIIERQIQKIKNREMFSTNNDAISEDDKW